MPDRTVGGLTAVRMMNHGYEVVGRDEENEYPFRYKPECEACGSEELVPWTVDPEDPDATGHRPRCDGEMEADGFVMWD